jgi:DNA polymerase-3 subunit alpha
MQHDKFLREGRLRKLVFASGRFEEIPFEVVRKELGAIEIHGLEDYFLEIYDKGIKVSNAPNSAVAYIIGITDEKPDGIIKYKGGTSPDIDIDFEHERRGEIVEYLKKKYGPEAVAKIGTVNKMYAKMAIRYVGKALGYDLAYVDELAKMIPDPVQGQNWTLQKVLEQNKDFKERVEKDEAAAEIVRWAQKLEGLISAKSSHAAGVVISNEDLKNIAPMRYDSEADENVLELDMNEVEDLGFLKVDLLGLKTLSVIKKTLELIKQNQGVELAMDLIPIDDKAIFELLKTGKLLGIFQLEGSGIAEFTKRFEPANFNDIVIISAGYRPGPMDFLFSILDIKRGNKPRITPHSERFPVLKEILSSTYGYFLYQEQIQKTVQLLAGYNDSEADEFRKMIAKKIKEKIPKEKKRFTEKARKKGLSDKEIAELWSEMESFGAYAFNLSHAVSYSFLTAKTAYLKAKFPTEFYTANLIFETDNTEKQMQFIDEARSVGIKVLPPSINHSGMEHTVVKTGVIRFGLSGLKGVGSSSQEIIEERRRNGKYLSVSDFIYRSKVRSNVLVSLAEVGCLDEFAARAQLLYRRSEDGPAYVEELMETVKMLDEKGFLQPENLVTEVLPYPLVFEMSIVDRLELEFRMMENWLSATPNEVYELEIQQASEGKSKRKSNDVITGYIKYHKKFKNGNGYVLEVLPYNAEERVTVFAFKDVAAECFGDRFKKNDFYNKLISFDVRQMPERNGQIAYALNKLTVLSGRRPRKKFPRHMTVYMKDLPDTLEEILRLKASDQSGDPLYLRVRKDELFFVFRVK